MELAILLSFILLVILFLNDTQTLWFILFFASMLTFTIFLLINIIGGLILRIKHKRKKVLAEPKRIFRHSGRHWFLSLVMFIIGIAILLLEISAVAFGHGVGVPEMEIYEIVSSIKLELELEYLEIILIVLLSFCAFEWIYHSFVKVKKRSPNIKHHNINSMTGIEFENYCAKVLAKNGYQKVSVTPASGDYGADIVAFDKNGNKWVVQCKKYKSKVGNSAVQEVIGAKAYYGASKAMVMTNSVLTDNAKHLAQVNNVKLWELIT